MTAKVCGNCRFYAAQGDEQAGGCYANPPNVHVLPMPKGPLAGSGVNMTPAYTRPMVTAADIGCRHHQYRENGVKGA